MSATQEKTSANAVANNDTRGSAELIERWIGARRTLSSVDIQALVDAARGDRGEMVGITTGRASDSDDICPRLVAYFPHPHVGSFVDKLASVGWNVRVFPYGVPQIDRALVQADRDLLR